MIDAQLAAFVAVAAVLTILPGADMALVARNVLADGCRAGYLTGVGCCTGLVFHALASALGLSAILMTSATLFSAVKLAGAAYLVALGAMSFVRALSTRAGDALGGPLTQMRGRSAARPFTEGLVSNLLNPKVGLFYLTLLPQFIGSGDSVLSRSLVLAAIHIVIGLAWLFTYAYFLGRLSETLRRPRIRAALEGATGVLLVALGARLAWDRR